MTVALVLAAALAVVCVLAVALPFIREPEPASDILDGLDADERRRLEVLEARDRALAALKELEFDHRTGTVSDEDYRLLVGPLRRDAANALQALERERGRSREGGEEGRATDRGEETERVAIAGPSKNGEKAEEAEKAETAETAETAMRAEEAEAVEAVEEHERLGEGRPAAERT